MEGRRRGDIREPRAHLSARESTRGAGRNQEEARTRKDRTPRLLRGDEICFEEVRCTSRSREKLVNQLSLRRETRKMTLENNHMLRAEIAPGTKSRFAARARHVLRRNDMGDWTRAAPNLYPHQWSWDSAFIAIGLAHFNTRRAARELLALFEHQWRTGKVPHIVFNPEAPPDS